MFILLTNRQKRKFADQLMKQYEEVFLLCGRKLSLSNKVRLYNNLYVTLKVKRSNNLPIYNKE